MATKSTTWGGFALLSSLSMLVFGSFALSYKVIDIVYFLVLLGYLLFIVRLKNTK